VSAQRAVLFKNDRAFLMAHRFLAYPTGIEFTFNLRLRNPDDYQPDLPWDMRRRRRQEPLPGDFLRLGLQLSDGTKWTNLDWRLWHPLPPDEQPKPPVVMHRQSGGGRYSYNMSFWLWPLPVGPLTVVTEWPAFDVPETRVVIDTTELRARAAEAEAIWPS
jgi:hypothetical protein